MLLSVKQLQFLLTELSFETVSEFDGRYRVQRKTNGYREGDPGKIQAALSVMLEAKAREEGRKR